VATATKRQHTTLVLVCGVVCRVLLQSRVFFLDQMSHFTEVRFVELLKT